MPLQLNVGFSRKVGEPNFSSRGASVHVELELEAELIHEPDQLRGRIRHLYDLARTAVDEELRAANAGGPDARAGHGDRQESTALPATPAQIRAIETMASRQDVDLAQLLDQQHGVSHTAELSRKQASRVIDFLSA